MPNFDDIDPYRSPRRRLSDLIGGKIEREQVREERRNFQVGGCGDPACPTCNPEIAAMIGRRSDGAYIRESMLRSIRDMDFRVMGGSPSFMSFETTTTAPPPSRKRREPPESYVEAREAVEKWIVKAPKQTFDDIKGNEEALALLRDAIEAPKTHAKLYKAYGMRMPKGALLSGPPGCGKTMFARAAASEMRRLYGKKVEMISISGSELQSPFIGVTEGYIKAIFTYAREFKAFHKIPLLVFMDEADVLLPDRTGRVRRVASWEESQVATFLAEMDGMQESGAFVLLATNRPEVIDQAVLRDGRCDFKIKVDRPNAEAIEAIIAKCFTGALAHDPVEQLVFAAVECLYDPHKIILESHLIRLKLNLGTGEIKEDAHDQRHFLLEHIISGAMATSIPERAKRLAFARDKANNSVTGITVADVVRAVDDIWNENKGLDHSFALNEFQQRFMAEVQERRKEASK